MVIVFIRPQLTLTNMRYDLLVFTFLLNNPDLKPNCLITKRFNSDLIC